LIFQSSNIGEYDLVGILLKYQLKLSLLPYFFINTAHHTEHFEIEEKRACCCVCDCRVTNSFQGVVRNLNLLFMHRLVDTPLEL